MDNEPTPKKARTVGELQSKEGVIAHVGSVFTASFSSHGMFFITGGEDRVIRLWDYLDGSLIADLTGQKSEVRDVCVSKDDTKMSSCGGDGRVLYWDLLAQRPVRIFGGHNDEVNAVKFNEFSSVVVSADSSVRVWDSRSHTIEPIQIFDTFKDSVTSLCLRRTEIIAGSLDGSVQKFDFRSKRRLSYNMGPSVKSMYLAVDDDEYALANCVDSTLQLLAIEPSNLSTIEEYKGHTCKSHKVGCCFTNQGANPIGGSEDGYIFIWDALSKCVVEKINAHTSVVTSLDYHPKDDCIISASADGSVYLWKA